MKRQRKTTRDLSQASVAECLRIDTKQRRLLLMSEKAVGFNHGWFASLVDCLSSKESSNIIEGGHINDDDWARELLGAALVISPRDDLAWSWGTRRRDVPLYIERLASRMGEYLKAAIEQKVPVVQEVAEARNILIGWAHHIRERHKAVA